MYTKDFISFVILRFTQDDNIVSFNKKHYLVSMEYGIPYICKETTAAFSGHRTIAAPVQGQLFGAVDTSPQEYLEILGAKLDMAVRKLVAEGYDTFLCGMAAGFDLMAGLAVCRLIGEGEPINLIALVPHPGQAARFGKQDRGDYEKVLSMACENYTVCPQYQKDCFHRRNDMLVENSSAIVCYYDGSQGGTHYTVKKALKAGSRVINLY